MYFNMLYLKSGPINTAPSVLDPVWWTLPDLARKTAQPAHEDVHATNDPSIILAEAIKMLQHPQQIHKHRCKICKRELEISVWSDLVQ